MKRSRQLNGAFEDVLGPLPDLSINYTLPATGTTTPAATSTTPVTTRPKFNSSLLVYGAFALVAVIFISQIGKPKNG